MDATGKSVARVVAAVVVTPGRAVVAAAVVVSLTPGKADELASVVVATAVVAAFVVAAVVPAVAVVAVVVVAAMAVVVKRASVHRSRDGFNARYFRPMMTTCCGPRPGCSEMDVERVTSQGRERDGIVTKQANKSRRLYSTEMNSGKKKKSSANE